MKQVYVDALERVLNMVEASHDALIINHAQFEKSIQPSVFLGDERFGAYHSMVKTNEYRAVKAIESLAVTLFSASNCTYFDLYPINPVYSALPKSEQIKTRPFQVILSEKGKKCGVVFCSLPDKNSYIDCFRNGGYSVDALKIVVPVSLDDDGKAFFDSYNKAFDDTDVSIKMIPVLDFWEQHFGKEESDELISFFDAFNERAKRIIGFSTIVEPTENALRKFREECGTAITSHDYLTKIPHTVFSNQVETIRKNYFDRGLWRAMIGTQNFADSFVTSEWFYTMYNLTENLDLTNIVTGYLKSIEQLLYCIIQLYDGTGITIQTKNRGIIQYSADAEDLVTFTLQTLENVIYHNGKVILDVNRYAKEYLLEVIDDWRDKQRNGYFHQHNLHDPTKVKEIREKALHLYFLILGSCTIADDQFRHLGIVTEELD